SYLFSTIAEKISAFEKKHPEKQIIKLGIGDVTMPLPQACIKAFHRGVDEMAEEATFRGYGPEQGYGFLRERIAETGFIQQGADIHADEIFISDGAKCDTGNLQELFDTNITVAIPDPVYPVYLDTNIMAGRSGELKDQRYERIVYLDATQENGFVPKLPDTKVDLIYLCFPNNPTGATITTEELKKWVDYAMDNKALIIYDAAYEAFIQDKDLPRSIYEIEGAQKVAIESRSFSKTAGFTGTRCAYTVVPKACMAYDHAGNTHSLHDMWKRRQSTKFNGVSYPVQMAAAAACSDEGRQEIQGLVSYYLKNAEIIRSQMQSLGLECTGGENSPYIWVASDMDSWGFFDLLLEKAGVVTTPGVGFGKCGQGYIRISAFNHREKVMDAISRIKKALA
ncbi:MAG: LL-diaminopimelate aminotransferase, partial [Thermodesulfobacteriota bacterium]|nr:LL-diaminopimelate aminotransferase [Thermodesulfobacteriota bacterium]